MYRQRLLLILIPLFINSINFVKSFHEDAIFEDEDIYLQALPPPENTTTGLTLPGTKWCGPGDTAKNFDDLGSQRETDKCCRAHDHCPEIIEHEKQLHGLLNPDIFPRLTCACEQAFMNCLQNVDNTVSLYLGRLYFGFRGKCFREDYPIVNCVQLQGAGKLAEKRCIRYKFDKTKSKLWQYFDTPFYSKKPV